MKKYLIAIFALLIGMTQLNAQRPHHPKHHPEMMQEMHEFMQTEMVPVLVEKKAELMSKLSKEDQAFISQKTAEANTLREGMKGSHQKIRKEKGDRKEMSETERNTMREKMRAHHEKILEFRESLVPFTERNEAVLKAAIEDLAPYYDKWIPAQMAIADKYIDDEDRPELPDMKGKKEGRFGLFGMATPKRHHRMDHKGHGKKGGKGNITKKEKGKAHPYPETRLAMQLLLWDGNAPIGPRQAGKLGNNNANTYQLNSVPNPAESTTKLSFTIDKDAAKVRLAVTDRDGQLIKDWTWKDLKAGTREVELAVNDLAGGVYFYTLEVDGTTATKRFVVK